MPWLIAVLCLMMLSAPAQQRQRTARAGPALSKIAIENYLRRLELWAPQVQIRIDDPQPFIPGLYRLEVHLTAGAASKDVTYYVSADGKTLIRGNAYELNRSPFQKELDALKLQYQPSFGPANAPLTLVVFSDFECPVCREEAQELRAKVRAEFPKDVRVAFFDFPLESIHPWAKPAAIAGRCVYHQNGPAFWDYFDWIYEHQPEIKVDNLKTKVMEWAFGTRLDTAQFSQCLDSRAMASEVDAEVATGRKLGVDSTPTNFLNGRRLVGDVPWPNLSQIFKLELELAKQPGK